MTRGIYTKWIIGAVFMLLIVATGCILYYQQTTAADKHAAAQAEKLLETWQADKAKPPTPAETESTKPTAESTTATAEKPTNKIGKGTETNTDKPTNVNIATSEKDNTEDVKMSAYGFGPYPDIPEGFEKNVGTPIWIKVERYGPFSSLDAVDIRDIELIDRVLIKLWQDVPESRAYMEGGFYRNSKVYVNYSNRAYVRYKTIELPDGTQSRVITSWTGGSLESPIPDPANPFESNSSEIPGEIELIDLDTEDPGIDPYTFLGL